PWPGWTCPRVRNYSCGWPPPDGTPKRSTAPPFSMCTERVPIDTWLSVKACTTAWAPTWASWKPRSPSPNSPAATPPCAWSPASTSPSTPTSPSAAPSPSSSTPPPEVTPHLHRAPHSGVDSGSGVTLGDYGAQKSPRSPDPPCYGRVPVAADAEVIGDTDPGSGLQSGAGRGPGDE